MPVWSFQQGLETRERVCVHKHILQVKATIQPDLNEDTMLGTVLAQFLLTKPGMDFNLVKHRPDRTCLKQVIDMRDYDQQELMQTRFHQKVPV